MIAFIMLLIILSLSFGIKIKLKIKQEESIFVSLYGITLLAYVLGLVNLLWLSIYIIPILCLISIIYTIVKLIKKQEKILELITLPTIIYSLIIIFIYNMTKNMSFAYYDEFMFWGTNLKVMVEKGCLWANSQIDGVHLIYPPFVAVTEYIFCMFNGGFGEGVTYFAMISLIFTSLMPMFKNEKYHIKSFFKVISIIAITYITTVLFLYNIVSLYIDCYLGIIFVVSMYLSYKANNKKDYFVLAIMLIAITLLKTNGILLAGISIMQIFFKEIFEIIENKEKNIKIIVKRLKIVGILLLLIILNFGLWKIYYTLNGKAIDDRHDKNYIDNINVAEFINAIFQNENASARSKKIARDFLDKIVNDKIIRKTSFYTTSWLFIIINVISLIYVIICKDKHKTLANILSINIGFIIYSLTILLTFMFVFQEYQGEVLMGFERYIPMYIMAMLLNIIYIILDEINLKTGIVAIIAFIIISKGMNQLMLDPREQNRYGIVKEHLKEFSQEILENVSSDKKVYIIDQKKDSGYEFMQMRYLISPIETNLLYEWDIGNSDEGIFYKMAISEEDFMSKLINENYDYVYIIDKNERFQHEYKNILSEELKIRFENFTESGILLKINKNTRKLEFCDV